ncbi:MAG: divalent-cation tolerance protein CutA [Planctomycetes bacterium]|nr:divalent-cation tolerance protein CutA [Planctomycetota bacterium]
MNAHLLITTVDDEAVARRLARGWVESRIAACVSIVPGVSSTYRWKGRVETATEQLLLVKFACDADEVEDRVARLSETHPYDVPELVVLDPTCVAPAYLRWLGIESHDQGV